MTERAIRRLPIDAGATGRYALSERQAPVRSLGGHEP